MSRDIAVAGLILTWQEWKTLDEDARRELVPWAEPARGLRSRARRAWLKRSLQPLWWRRAGRLAVLLVWRARAWAHSARRVVNAWCSAAIPGKTHPPRRKLRT